MDIEIGQRLAARRRTHGLSQEELAARLGLSRQAVSNWERAETAPDTDNLIALAKLYGVTLDELLQSEPSSAEDSQPAALAEDGALVTAPPSTRRADVLAFVIAAVVSFVFYYAIAQPLLFSTVDDITSLFGLGVSPLTGVIWILAEGLFMLVPYLLLAPIASLTHSRSRLLWLAPALTFVIPVGLSIAWGATLGAPAGGFSGIGGSLIPSIALKTDVVASIAGCLIAAAFARRLAA